MRPPPAAAPAGRLARAAGAPGRQAVAPARMAKAAKEMDRPVLRFTIDLGMGRAAEKVLTCDLTHEYVSINAEYPT